MTTDKPTTGHDAETRLPQRSERGDTTDEVTFPYQRLPLAAIARALGTLCLVAVLVPFLVFAVPQTVGADHGFVILSGSMEPALSPGDVVIVSDTASVEVGDIITFSNGGSIPVTHRVVGVQDGQYVTKGDANGNPDTAPVAPGSVLGGVVYTIPLIGYVILWANTPTGQVALVLVPLFLLGVSSLRRWASDENDPATDGDETPVETPTDGTDLAVMFDAVPATDGDWTPPDEWTPQSPEVSEAATVRAEPTATDDAVVGVPAPDLKLTLLSTAVLFAYAGWNVSREMATTGVPNPVSVGILTAGLLGLGFALWTTLSVAPIAAAEADKAASNDPEPTAVDGGVEMEDGA